MSLKLLIDPISNILDKFVADKDERNRLAHEIATMAARHSHELSLGQIEVNKQEAQHDSLFVAGWRPGVGWICVFGLGVNYVALPLASMGVAVYNGQPIQPMELGELIPILLGMLGLGGLRTLEKYHHVSREGLRGRDRI
jgi:hypothetical protein